MHDPRFPCLPPFILKAQLEAAPQLLRKIQIPQVVLPRQQPLQDRITHRAGGTRFTRLPRRIVDRIQGKLPLDRGALQDIVLEIGTKGIRGIMLPTPKDRVLLIRQLEIHADPEVGSFRVGYPRVDGELTQVVVAAVEIRARVVELVSPLPKDTRKGNGLVEIEPRP